MKLRSRLFALPLLAMLAACSITGCHSGSALSKRDEITIGREGSKQVEQAYKLDPDPQHQQLVQELGQRLVIANGLKMYPYTFKVLDDKEINAFSLPGGPVYVFRGLVEMSNRDELATVLAHELGHIENRHVAKQYTKGLWMDVAASVLTGGRNSDVANIALALQELSFSRKDEYQADEFGIQASYKAGFDPNAMITFFQKLKAKEKGGDKGILANLQTHPLTDNRIAHARQQIAKVTGAPLPILSH